MKTRGCAVGGWHEANTMEEITCLLEFFGGFHDSCIKELRYTSGVQVDADDTMQFGEVHDRQVDVVFQRQGLPRAVALRFLGMRAMNIAGWQQNYGCEIFDCHLAVHADLIADSCDRLVVWADCAAFNPKEFFQGELLEEPRVSFVIAEKMLWRAG